MHPITVTSMVTKKIVEDGLPIHRYFFQWSDRNTLGALVLRMELLDDSGRVLASGSINLPKTKRELTQTGEGEIWVYDQTPYFYLDDVASHQATKFRFTAVVGLLKKYPAIEGVMNEKFEDLSIYG
ncbi:hypothetical protein [Larkinella sp. C7]|uniref:hypothetical protein n=1 Tax=Larkinella sp. C7 TaxID=2576607 RepID=UPI001BB238C8|nr:hypothetical protein [Larkinella sp. C7]